MKKDLFETLGLAVLAALLASVVVSGQMASALTSQGTHAGCSINFSGHLATLQKAPAGTWTLTSSACSVTARSGGVTSGSFSGSFSSSGATSVVSGTWSAAGSTQSVVASSVGFTLSFTVDQSLGPIPLSGSPIQGTLTGVADPTMVVVDASGQVAL